MTRRNFETDALTRFLALTPYKIDYVDPDEGVSQADIDAATERLNALPADEQVVIFCQSMGWSVFDYLHQRGVFNAEMAAEIDWLDLDLMGA